MQPSFTREEIALQARETAARLVAALGGGGLAAGFVRRYAAANRRRALLAHPSHYRELIERISREALLAMVARVELDLSRRFSAGTGRRGRRSAQRKSAGDSALANHFRVEFYGSLAQRLDWEREELGDFWRDLDLYTGAARAPRPRKLRQGARKRKANLHLGPFADRCAFLLDSSLLERARRAAAGLQGELELTARKTMNAVFRRAGAARIGSRPLPRRAAGFQRAGKRRAKGKKPAARRRKKGGRR